MEVCSSSNRNLTDRLPNQGPLSRDYTNSRNFFWDISFVPDDPDLRLFGLELVLPTHPYESLPWVTFQITQEVVLKKGKSWLLRCWQELEEWKSDPQTRPLFQAFGAMKSELSLLSSLSFLSSFLAFSSLPFFPPFLSLTSSYLQMYLIYATRS